MNKYSIEFIGSFFLILVIGLAVTLAPETAPLAIGSILMVMIYMGGHISGAHYNPAVSFAFLISKKMTASEFMKYMASQISGGILAGLLSRFLLNKGTAILPNSDFNLMQILLAEALFTFALVAVILNVTCSNNQKNNSFYGIAIGFTVLASAYAIGPISGAALNPAVAIGHNIFSENLNVLWIYFLGPLAGGALAGCFFKKLDHN